MDCGKRDSTSACPKTWCHTLSVLQAPLEDLHFAPSAHRFMNFVCVPSVPFQFVGRRSSHHCVVHEVKQVSTVAVLRLRVVQTDIILSIGPLLDFLLEDRFSGFLDGCRPLHLDSVQSVARVFCELFA